MRRNAVLEVGEVVSIEDRVPLLELREVSKAFRRRDGSILQAVESVSFSINENESVALVGESGSGKSTLARIALWLSKPDSGEVLFKGRSVSGMSAEVLRQYRLSVQPIFQDPAAAFNPRRRVGGSLAQALRQVGKADSEIPPAVLEHLRSVRLTPPEDYAVRYPHELSGGQRQRVGIAKALAVDPVLLIADEPLSGVDASIRGQILNLLEDLQKARRVAYLLITHDISLARAFSHRVAVMHLGRIVEAGLTHDVLANPKDPYTQRLLAAVPTLG
jgi:ABC-type oligopeptide transport system ATPase subunit